MELWSLELHLFPWFEFLGFRPQKPWPPFLWLVPACPLSWTPCWADLSPSPSGPRGTVAIGFVSEPDVKRFRSLCCLLSPNMGQALALGYFCSSPA